MPRSLLQPDDTQPENSLTDSAGQDLYSRRSDSLLFTRRASRKSIYVPPPPNPQFRVPSSLRRLPKTQQSLLIAREKERARNEAEITIAGERGREVVTRERNGDMSSIDDMSKQEERQTDLGRLQSQHSVSSSHRRATAQSKWKQEIKTDQLIGGKKKLRVVIALSSWMGHPKIREMSLWDVCIPGTHNSASWKLSEDHQRKWSGVVFAFLKLYIHCQLGIRFLDLRVCKNLARNGEPYCAHGGFRTIPFKEAIDQVNAFLERHPTEIIILSVRRDVAYLSGPGSLGILESDFWVAVCLKQWLGCQLDEMITIGELADRHQNVLYFFEERERFLPPLQKSEPLQQTIHPSSPSTETLILGPEPSEPKSSHEQTFQQRMLTKSLEEVSRQTEEKLSQESSIESRRISTSSSDRKLAPPRRSIMATLLSPRLAVTTAAGNVQHFGTPSDLFFLPRRRKTSNASSVGSEMSADTQSKENSEYSGGEVQKVQKKKVVAFQREEIVTPMKDERRKSVPYERGSHVDDYRDGQYNPSDSEALLERERTSDSLKSNIHADSLFRPQRQLTRWVRNNVPKYWCTRLESMPDHIFLDLFGEEEKQMSENKMHEKIKEWFDSPMVPILPSDQHPDQRRSKPLRRSYSLVDSFSATADEPSLQAEVSHKSREFKPVRRKVKRRLSYPTVGKRKMKTLSAIVTSAVKLANGAKASKHRVDDPLARRADSVTFSQGGMTDLKRTEKTLEMRHKEAVDAARALIEKSRMNGASDGAGEAKSTGNSSSDAKKTKLNGRVSLKSRRTSTGNVNKKKESTMHDFQNFLQVMKSGQSSQIFPDRGELEDEGYASDRSGITALPAAKAMENLLGQNTATVSEALEKAGVDTTDLGLEGETVTPSDTMIGSRMSSRYSDPDLQRLISRAEITEEQSSIDQIKDVTDVKSRRRSRSSDTLIAEAGDPLIIGRQSTTFGGFGSKADFGNSPEIDTIETRGYHERGNLIKLMDEMQEGGRLYGKLQIEEAVIHQNEEQNIHQIEKPVVSSERLPELLLTEITSEDHRQRKAARMSRTAQRHRPNQSPRSIKLTRQQIVQSFSGREAADGSVHPLTPFVSGRSRIIKSWHMTCDPDPSMLCKKLVYWTTLEGCARPRNPFIIRMLAGEVTPPSFDSPETSMEVVRFWTVQGATALVLRNGGLRTAAVETHKLLLSNILNRAITNRVNGVTHDFVSESIVSRIVKLNILAAVGPEELRKLRNKAKEEEVAS